MSEKKAFSHRAASLCLSLPLFGNLLILAIESEYLPTPLDAFAIYGIGIVMLLVPITWVMGIIALFGIRHHGRKRILMPTIAGLIISVGVFYQAAFAGNAYIKTQVYFEIACIEKIGEQTQETLLLGRMSQVNDIEFYLSNLENALPKQSPNFSIVRKRAIPGVPVIYEGIFDNKQLSYTYIFTDSDALDGVDLRVLYPCANGQPSCDEMEPILTELKPSADANGDQAAIVGCVEASTVGS